jgi:AAA15 family ATPase/GTPase
MEIKILSLTVKNCGALKDIKIDFTDNGKPQSVIVLAGANGSGKTTVLELIFALAELFKFKKIPEILRQTKYAEIELLIDDENHKVFFYKPSRIDFTNKLDEKINNLIKLNDETIPSILYFPHNRELFSVKGEQIFREEIKYQWCYRYQNHSDFQGSLESYLIWLDYAEPEIFQVVIDFLNQLDLEGKTFYIDRKRLSVMVKTRYGNEHPFNKLSSGEQNILIMLLELRRRLIPGSIVLLDEIENSLHPAFQHRLAQNLLQLQKQIPFQLILTTHQSVFVKIFGENNTRILTEF